MTLLAEVIEQQLGAPLDKWLATQRGAGLTWEQIALMIEQKTRRSVSRETVRTWGVGHGVE